MEYWFKHLDKKRAKEKSHAEIFEMAGTIDRLSKLGEWNLNLFVTTYEWNRGLKKRGQRNDGFEKSVSKTINASAKDIFHAWINKGIRRKWLSENDITIRKSTTDKSIVISWKDDSTVRVELYDAGNGKSRVVVQHMKISGSVKAEALKSFWISQMNNLKNILEKK